VETEKKIERMSFLAPARRQLRDYSPAVAPEFTLTATFLVGEEG
jgi:hypothetical protein